MRRRRLLWAFGALAALLVVAAVAIPLVLQSQWLSDQVRARLVSEVESATGGRAEIGGFHFNWKQLRVELQNFTLHGTEPAGKPPLFHASEIVVGLTIVSAFRVRSLRAKDIAARRRVPQNAATDRDGRPSGSIR